MAQESTIGAYGAIFALLLLVMMLILAVAGGVQPVLDTSRFQLERPQLPPLPPLSAHALKHAEAVRVARFLSEYDWRFCRYDCGNRIYLACRMPDGYFAFAVIDAAWQTIITAFITDANYALRVKDDPRCRPFINAAHP